MMTLCWKELRENFRWALLVLAGLGVAQWYALHAGEEKYSFGYNWNGKGLLLNSTPFLAVTTFGCAAAGLLLGFLQILPELRRDRWASLLHRPVSRGVVFRGKVSGGLLLYALATVPPFLFSVWLVATPGHFAAPFVPAMAEAGAADICAGAAYYFAALAMTLPRGVWFGTRVLPLLAAAHLTYAVGDAEFFYVAMEAAVLMSLALFTAGWATMLHQDRLGPRPWIGRAACLAVAFYGVCGLGDLSVSLWNVIGPSRHSRGVDDDLSDSGIPLRLTYVDSVVVSVTDPSGNPPADRKLQPDQVRSHLKYLNRCSAYIGDSHGWHLNSYHYSYRESERYATFLRAYAYPRMEQWFYLYQQRIWVSYSPTSKLPVARLGRAGFEPLSAPPEPLDEETRYDVNDDHLILYDQDHATFHSLSQRRRFELALASPGPIYGTNTAYASVGNRNVSVFGVALADRLAVYDEHGALAATLPYHQNVDRWGAVSLGMRGDKDRFYLHYAPSLWLPEEVRAGMPTYYEEMNAKGELLRSDTVPPAPPYWWSRSWSDYVAHRVQSPAFFFGGMIYQKVGAQLGSKRLADQLDRRFGHDRDLTRELTIVLLLLSTCLAGGAWFWSRRAGFSVRRALAWSIFVFAGGLAGLIVFRAAADWPLFVSCPNCRQPRPTGGEQCPRCGAGWPSAPALGIEIFDHDAASAPAEVRP